MLAPHDEDDEGDEEEVHPWEAPEDADVESGDTDSAQPHDGSERGDVSESDVEGADVPAVPEDRSPAPVDRMVETLRDLDGHCNEVLIPLEANDIGDADVRANPRARDLEYAEGAGEVTHSEEAGFHYFFDGPNIHLAGDVYIGVDKDTFIEDVKEMA